MDVFENANCPVSVDYIKQDGVIIRGINFFLSPLLVPTEHHPFLSCFQCTVALNEALITALARLSNCTFERFHFF